VLRVEPAEPQEIAGRAAGPANRTRRLDAVGHDDHWAAVSDRPEVCDLVWEEGVHRCRARDETLFPGPPPKPLRHASAPHDIRVVGTARFEQVRNTGGAGDDRRTQIVGGPAAMEDEEIHPPEEAVESDGDPGRMRTAVLQPPPRGRSQSGRRLAVLEGDRHLGARRGQRGRPAPDGARHSPIADCRAGVIADESKTLAHDSGTTPHASVAMPCGTLLGTGSSP